ncbi:hypothetical protein ABE65_017015 [Fictibacillus phosphorivorans]|uniref:STAS domain-containing protein n=1 Tax=Fictibacillus phosphorivorans TaxID=1221500 RepID=A0A160IQA2_9BACL|nr:STAS domain-containing protein [Fictibacillus phosphorivorans]ANC78406.1 hypothetical protein ABE65_017015 [Fictibacillus phosphorivorans]
MNYVLEGTIKDTLNCLEENIFFIDQDLHISWMNNSSKNLLQVMKKYLNIGTPEDMIGQPIKSLHKNFLQEELMNYNEFPIDAQIVLFDRFVARLIVTELLVENQKRGYLLTWKDLTEREQERERTKEILNELATPILQTVAEHTLLVPLIGELTLERLETLTTKLLKECLNNGADYVILDFSGVTTITDSELGIEIQNLTDAIKLMGADVLYCGFPKEMVKDMVSLGVHTNQLSFVSFRNAIRYVVKEQEK